MSKVIVSCDKCPEDHYLPVKDVFFNRHGNHWWTQHQCPATGHWNNRRYEEQRASVAYARANFPFYAFPLSMSERIMVDLLCADSLDEVVQGVVDLTEDELSIVMNKELVND